LFVIPRVCEFFEMTKNNRSKLLDNCCCFGAFSEEIHKLRAQAAPFGCGRGSRTEARSNRPTVSLSSLAFKLLVIAQRRWRRIDRVTLSPLVRA
jgi:hypothetical protein